MRSGEWWRGEAGRGRTAAGQGPWEALQGPEQVPGGSRVTWRPRRGLWGGVEGRRRTAGGGSPHGGTRRSVLASTRTAGPWGQGRWVGGDNTARRTRRDRFSSGQRARVESVTAVAATVGGEWNRRVASVMFRLPVVVGPEHRALRQQQSIVSYTNTAAPQSPISVSRKGGVAPLLVPPFLDNVQAATNAGDDAIFAIHF